MKKANPTMLSLIYGISTLIAIVVWIFLPDLSYCIGAASIMQLFVFAVGSGNKYIFIALSFVVLIFSFCLVVAVRNAYKKHQYKMVMVLMWVDVIISAILLVYNLIMQNYISTLYSAAFGILVRGLFVVYYSRTMKKAADESLS